ncbi:MAG: phosphohistidine phosphatase SixA [Candidatus Eiseniibacteriota bacterium]
MRLVLFRHGPAGSADAVRWPDDSGRPLSARGEEKTHRAAEGLAGLLGDDPVTIWTSPLIRAEQTARHLEAALRGRARVEVVEALAPGGSERAILDSLSRLAGDPTVVLVGHEPDLGTLAGSLVSPGHPLALKKAGVCAIEFEGPAARGRGELAWFLPPRILRALPRLGRVNA